MKLYIPNSKKRLAKLLYECGITPVDICEICDISRTTLFKLIKKELWQKGKNLEYIKALKQVLELETQLTREEKYMADSIAECMVNHKSLIVDLLVSTVSKAQEKVNKGTKQTLVKLNDGQGERIEVVTEELSVKDLKDVVDIADKAGMALGVSERLANAVKEDGVTVIEPFRGGLKISQKTSKDVNWEAEHRK